jgi:hypothetical protein
MSKCHFCFEEIEDNSIVCPSCGRDLVSGARPSSPPEKAGGPAANPDLAIYQRGGVTIARTQAVFPGRVYRFSDISSVSAKMSLAAAPIWALNFVMIIIGLTGLLIGLGFYGQRDSPPHFWAVVWPCPVVGALLAIGGFSGLVRARYTYAVHIAGNSGEADAIHSDNKGDIDMIVKAMNQAMASQRKTRQARSNAAASQLR